MFGYLHGKRSGSKIASTNQKEGDKVGAGSNTETGYGGQDPHGGHGYIHEGDRAHVVARRVSHGMAEIKLLCFRWSSPFLKLPAYGDGTDSVPKCWHIKFRRWRITGKKAHKIKN